MMIGKTARNMQNVDNSKEYYTTLHLTVMLKNDEMSVITDIPCRWLQTTADICVDIRQTVHLFDDEHVYMYQLHGRLCNIKIALIFI